MKRKIYLSNILRHWPIEAQRKALAHIPKPVEIYEDVLKPRALKAHSPADLTGRAELLRPTARRNAAEVICVASLGVLAWVAEDFMMAMAAAAKRNAVVSVQETGREIPPTATAKELAEALSEFLASRRRHQTTGGRLAGVQASRALRMEDAQKRKALIEADWHGTEVPTSVLLDRAGKERRGRWVPMAWATAVRLMGRRPTTEQFRKAEAKRKAKT